MKRKKLGVKNCVLGANCKNTCINQDDNCLVPKSAKVKTAVSKLKAPAPSLLSAFESKQGSIPAAAKLLTALFDKKNLAGETWSASISSELKNPVSDFMRMAGLKSLPIKTISSEDTRSEANRQLGTIKINKSLDALNARKQVFHELGHFLAQNNSANIKAEKDFIENRKNPSSKPELLSIITGNKKYGTERAYVGNFPNAYTAKFYLSGATEVFSTGFERFSSASELSKFYKEDPDHFKLIMSVLND